MGRKDNTWISKLNEKDEYYTPRILVNAILPYIPKDKIIWCPFDTEDSEFVIGLKENGNKVINSHIWEGKDFFLYEPNDYDIIVSNPPFSLKLQVLERLYKLNKPFAMAMGVQMLNYQSIGSFFVNKEIQLLIVDKKVSFDGKGSMFNTSYFCKGILPKDLMFCHLNNNNVGKFYQQSKMYENLWERNKQIQIVLLT